MSNNKTQTTQSRLFSATIKSSSTIAEGPRVSGTLHTLETSGRIIA